MTLTNHLVINVLIVVAYYVFYVISVNVSISCQISKILSFFHCGRLIQLSLDYQTTKSWFITCIQNFSLPLNELLLLV